MNLQEIPDLIYKTKLITKIILEGSKIITKQEKDRIHSKKDQELLKLFNYILKLKNVLEDLCTVFSFLNFDIKNLEQNFPDIEQEETYYKYHFENFYIRIMTIPDIVGKFGNILYQTNINDDKCDAYKFKIKLETIKNTNSKLIDDILKQTNDIKKFRNTKLHKGDAEIKNFKGLIFWSDLKKVSGIEADAVLYDISNYNLQEEIKKLKSELISLINLVNTFFEKSENEFNLLIKN